MFVVSVSEHSLPSETIASSVFGLTVFSIWAAIGLVALIVGAIAVRVSTQRLNRIESAPSEEQVSVAPGAGQFPQIPTAA